VCLTLCVCEMFGDIVKVTPSSNMLVTLCLSCLGGLCVCVCLTVCICEMFGDIVKVTLVLVTICLMCFGFVFVCVSVCMYMCVLSVCVFQRHPFSQCIS